MLWVQSNCHRTYWPDLSSALNELRQEDKSFAFFQKLFPSVELPISVSLLNTSDVVITKDISDRYLFIPSISSFNSSLLEKELLALYESSIDVAGWDFPEKQVFIQEICSYSIETLKDILYTSMQFGYEGAIVNVIGQSKRPGRESLQPDWHIDKRLCQDLNQECREPFNEVIIIPWKGSTTLYADFDDADENNGLSLRMQIISRFKETTHVYWTTTDDEAEYVKGVAALSIKRVEYEDFASVHRSGLPGGAIHAYPGDRNRLLWVITLGNTEEVCLFAERYASSQAIYDWSTLLRDL